MKTRLLALVAASLAMALGFSGNAYAGAYAISYDNLDNIIVIDTPPNTINVLSFVPLSAANATLNGASANTGGIGVQDAPVANAPGSAPLRAENAFNQIGIQATNYSNADAQIVQTQIGGATFTNAVNIAENSLASNASASADAENSSLTGFQVIFDIISPTTATILFEADPYMQVFLNPDSRLGSVALAELTANASIVDSFGNTVFDWSPDGVVGTGISGGAESADDADLNRIIQTAIPGTSAVYDPTNDASFGGVFGAGTGAANTAIFPCQLTGSCFYSATTNVLPVGQYTLSLAMEEDVGTIKLVPEPTSLALMGLALAGLGFWGRKRQA